jgi:hypothetical protein
MVSTWWLIVAVFGGACGGILLMALMQLSAEMWKRTPTVQDLSGLSTPDGLA